MSPLWPPRKAVVIAQQAVDSFRPDVIVGSSMGGALATQLHSNAALVLIAPATRISWLPVGFGPYPDRPVPPETIILHSKNDRLVPLEASRALLRMSQPGDLEGLETVRRVGVGLSGLGYTPEDQRLLILGASHSCNEPDFEAEGKHRGHPHGALVEAARVVAEVAGGVRGFRVAG